jgi:phosphoenolpyruvate carboxykinase (ATP)
VASRQPAVASAKFDQLLADGAYISSRVYTQDVFACADPRFRLRVRVIPCRAAWHTFSPATCSSARPRTADELRPDFTVMAAVRPADPQADGTLSGTFILVNLGKRIVIIGGTGYASEIRVDLHRAQLPPSGAGGLPMHCSANTEPDGSDVALFFGLTAPARQPFRPSRRAG